MRSARTPAGALVRGGPPVVTFGYIGACILLFLFQLAQPRFTYDFAFVPVLAHAEPWRYLTSAFLHDAGSGPLSLHLAMNMYCLWVLGQGLEPLLGRLRYLVVLVLSALGGSVAYQLLIGSESFSMMVGASGALFGLFGTLLTGGRRFGLNVRGIAAVVAVNAALGFMVPNIAWQAHLGGFLVGAALGIIMTVGGAARRSLIQIIGCSAILVALIVAAWVG